MKDTFKSSIFDILDKSEQNGIVEKIFDVVMIFLIFTNVIAVIIEARYEKGSEQCFGIALILF